ncbi:hypothetical protein QLX67_07100, partial [Balneolaceae bacterium ANBcel3]|nr:hypothetical protein [Balneolaceae bacterium ANBcel3]
ILKRTIIKADRRVNSEQREDLLSVLIAMSLEKKVAGVKVGCFFLNYPVWVIIPTNKWVTGTWMKSYGVADYKKLIKKLFYRRRL